MLLVLCAACASKPAGGRRAGLDAGESDAAGPSVDTQVLSENDPDSKPASTDLGVGRDTIMKVSDDLPFGWTSSLPSGAPGWRNTPAALCEFSQALGMGEIAGVWADSRGVFVLGNTDCGYLDRILTGCPPIDGQGHSSLVVEFNDGSGWRQVWETAPASYARLTGIPEGPLVVSGRNDCDVAQVDTKTGVETCWLDLQESLGYLQPTFIVDSAVSYQADNDHFKYTGRFLDYRGGAWKPEIAKLPDAINAIWGTATTAYLAGEFQLYVWSSDSPASVRPVPNAPAARYTGAWGFAENDVWLGNSAGQLVHYDGSGFTVLQVSAPERRGILGLWGQAGVLYFRTQTEFGRVVQGRAEILLSAVPEQNAMIAGMWGTSANDVFLALQGALDVDMTPCRHNSLHWFDGKSFHRF